MLMIVILAEEESETEFIWDAEELESKGVRKITADIYDNQIWKD